MGPIVRAHLQHALQTLVDGASGVSCQERRPQTNFQRHLHGYSESCLMVDKPARILCKLSFYMRY